MEIAFRRLLIRIGKSLPFILCAIILVSCVEMLFAAATSDFIYYDGYFIVNTPISFAIGLKFEYDLLVCFLVLITSIAIRACKWNLYATLYLFFHLAEKSHFDYELDIDDIYVIAITNMAVAAFFTYKGFKILILK